MLQKWYFLWYLQLSMHICMCMETCAFGWMWSHIRVHMGNWGRCQWLFSKNYFYIEARFLLNLKLAIWSSLAHKLELWVTSLHFQCLGTTGGLAHSHCYYLNPGDRNSDPPRCRESVFINYLRFFLIVLWLYSPSFSALLFCFVLSKSIKFNLCYLTILVWGTCPGIWSIFQILHYQGKPTLYLQGGFKCS